MCIRDSAFINKYANEVVKEKARDHSKSISDNRIRSGYDRPRLIRRSRLDSSHGRRYRSRSLSEGGRKHSRSRTRSNERYRSPVCKRFPSYSADNRYSRGRGRRNSHPEERDRSWRGGISLYDSTMKRRVKAETKRREDTTTRMYQRKF